MTKKLFLLFLFILSLVSCTYPQTTWAPIARDKLPGAVAVVQLRSNDNFYPKCSGVLVKKNAVLTAAHCIDNLSVSQVGVVFNCEDISDSNCLGSKTYAMAHRDDLDIALILLKDNLTEFKNKENEDLPPLVGMNIATIASSSPAEGQFLLVGGFGFRGKLKVGAAMTYIGGSDVFVTDFRNQSRPEHGDSGGPAYSIQGDNLELAGITSDFLIVTDIHTGENFYGVAHVDATQNKRWIEETYEELVTKIKI